MELLGQPLELALGLRQTANVYAALLQRKCMDQAVQWIYSFLICGCIVDNTTPRQHDKTTPRQHDITRATTRHQGGRQHDSARATTQYQGATARQHETKTCPQRASIMETCWRLKHVAVGPTVTQT